MMATVLFFSSAEVAVFFVKSFSHIVLVSGFQFLVELV